MKKVISKVNSFFDEKKIPLQVSKKDDYLMLVFTGKECF